MYFNLLSLYLFQSHYVKKHFWRNKNYFAKNQEEKKFAAAVRMWRVDAQEGQVGCKQENKTKTIRMTCERMCTPLRYNAFPENASTYLKVDDETI